MADNILDSLSDSLDIEQRVQYQNILDSLDMDSIRAVESLRSHV